MLKNSSALCVKYFRKFVVDGLNVGSPIDISKLYWIEI